MIIVHCSDSNFGNAALIDHWHRTRKLKPFKKIGYTNIILNGKISSRFSFQSFFDGLIETGRDYRAMGAHCVGHNSSIGICLIGKYSFSPSQFKSLIKLIKYYGVQKHEVRGHRDFSDKTCPNFDVQEVLKKYWS